MMNKKTKEHITMVVNITLMWVALFLILITNHVGASELSLNVKHLTDNSNDESFHFQSHRGFEIKYQPEKDSFYYFASYDTAKVIMKAPVFDIEFIGLGAGIKKPVSKSINVYGQFGYYIVDTSINGRTGLCQLPCGEGLYYGVNYHWAALHGRGTAIRFHEYEVNPENGYGFTIGAELLHPLTKSLTLSFGIEYRALSFGLGVHGMTGAIGTYDKTGARWESYFKGSESTNYMVGINYVF